MTTSVSDEGETDQREERPAGGWKFHTLISSDGIEPPANCSGREAEASWCAVSAPWHPALLSVGDVLPHIESIDTPSPPGPREVRILANGLAERLPSGYRTQAEDAGTIVLEGCAERAALVDEIAARLAVSTLPGSPELESLVSDFLALGAASWWLRDIASAMGRGDAIDHESLAREVFAGAAAWATADHNTAKNRLRAAFEVLTHAREKFYPVDAYIIDVCLLDPAMPGGVLSEPMSPRTPITFLAAAKAIEVQAERDPDSLARLREAIGEGWADVAGGAYSEADEPLSPLESILWQFRQGSQVYAAHLDGRNVETLARRRFGLYPMLPQIAKRFAFRFAVHLGFDAGRFPIRAEPKRLWESPDHSSLESLTRPPLAADRPEQGARWPWRMAASMKDDHVATLGLVHWPAPVAGWYLDLRRIAGYSPVFARWVTLNDYFHLTDRPYESFLPEPDEYVTPYLAQAVARNDPTPIAGRARHARLRGRFDAVRATHALAEALGEQATDSASTLPSIELDLETGRFDEAQAALDSIESHWAAALARGVVGANTGARPGFLVVNPVGVARRVAVLLPEAAADLRPEGPLRAAQLTEEGVWAVVEVAAFGYAWIPRDTNLKASPAPVGALSARGHSLRNESISIEIDPKTGGLRGLEGAGEETPRVGQQLVAAGLVGSDGTAVSTRMRCDGFEVDYAGPALVQAVSRGVLLGVGNRPLATFRQRFRLWTGRPILEIDVALSDLDPAWLSGLVSADPWTCYLACRWAWPDPNSMLRRTCLLAPELTEVERPETPDAIDISTRRHRTALLFGGLAHHRRHGNRMLDTILLAGRETARSFTLGVALDLEHPFHASTDLLAPAYVVPTDAGPPSSGAAGWLVQVDNKGIAVTGLELLQSAEDAGGWGLALHLLETAGRAVRCRVRLFRDATWAKQTDFLRAVIVDLPIEGDSVLVDFTPHELARVEITLG